MSIKNFRSGPRALRGELFLRERLTLDITLIVRAWLQAPKTLHAEIPICYHLVMMFSLVPLLQAIHG